MGDAHKGQDVFGTGLKELFHDELGIILGPFFIIGGLRRCRVLLDMATKAACVFDTRGNAVEGLTLNKAQGADMDTP